MPLPAFLKTFFRNNHKFGSRDRHYIAELLYGMYRLGIQPEGIPVKTRLLSGSFLTGRLPKLFYEKCDQAMAERYDLSFDEKSAWIFNEHGIQINIPAVLSKGISEQAFIAHLFSKPRVFIRIRKDRKEVIRLLDQKGAMYEVVSDSILSFDVRSRIEDLLPADSYAVQDYSSQQIGHYLNPSAKQHWWDCCAGSGGKSILLLDKHPAIKLTVTDIREQILQNLRIRMKGYGYEHAYNAYCLDVSEKGVAPPGSPFDAVIADVPCSGSGTWNRSPEQFYFFTSTKIEHYTNLQEQIARNAIAQCKPGGSVYYITCSAFSRENEEVVQSLLTQYPVSLHEQQLIDATPHSGDYMFISVLKKH